MRKFLFATMIVAVLAGCQTAPTTDTGAPIDDKSATPNTGATTSGAGDGRVTGITTGSGTGTNMPAVLKDPNNILSKRVVFFDYDSFVVREEFKPLIEAHAKFLQQNRTMKMTIQGHTDERGSPSYNDQLSAARAQAVAEALHQRGLDYTIKTEGHGEREPFQADDRSKYSEEDLFAFDRRVEFKIVQ